MQSTEKLVTVIVRQEIFKMKNFESSASVISFHESNKELDFRSTNFIKKKKKIHMEVVSVKLTPIFEENPTVEITSFKVTGKEALSFLVFF